MQTAKKRKSHQQSKYLTLMIIPDSTATKVRSLKVPHWIIHLFVSFVLCCVVVIGGLSVINSYSQAKLMETAKLIEETNEEKKELLDQKSKIELQKQRIERSLNSQQGDFDKQLEFYMEQLLGIETRLAEIEKQAQDNYDKMNTPGSPVSKTSVETFMGGAYKPVFEEGAGPEERLNLLLATIDVLCESTEGFMEEYSGDVSKFVDYREHFPNIWPVIGRVTSEQGYRSDPINGSDSNHTGIDIKVDTGTYVKSTGDGTVTKAEYNSGYGYMVVVDHGYGLETLYAHNSRLLVSVGDKVKSGDYVALSGNTGRSTGPHVHYEVRLNGVVKNPRNYFGTFDY